jgi:TetR/AcrR family transcriptional regulator, cholesterol catabolism regulator
MFHFAAMRNREDRGRRILKAAVELAERGGFDAVRQREVAAQAGVALGTLYKRFASKEELLLAALELEVEKFEHRLKLRPLKGDTAVERITSLFSSALTAFIRKPHLGRATIRAATSGTLSKRFLDYHAMLIRHVVTAIDDKEMIAAGAPVLSSEQKHVVGVLLLQIWFTSLVGWAAGVQDPKSMSGQITMSADILIRGLQAGALASIERPALRSGGTNQGARTKARRASAV